MDAEFAQLTKAFKGIVKNYLDNEKISDVVYATYTGGSLVIDNRPIPVPLDMVDIPLHLQTLTGLLSCDLSEGLEEIQAKDENGKKVEVKRLKLTDAPVTIKTGLAPGARVAVVQKRGANKYSIIDEVTGV